MSMQSLPAGSGKRHKDGSGPSGSPPSGGNFHQPPPFYQQGAPYGQQQYPMQPQPGYNNMWQHGQQQPPFGNQGPPPSLPYGQQGGMYRQPPAGGAPPQNGPPMTPDRSGPNWNGFRGPPQQQQGRRQNGVSNTQQRPKGATGGGSTPSNVPPMQPPQPGGPQQYQQWGQPQQPWPPQGQWGGAPPPVWQNGPPMPPQPSPPPPNAQPMPQNMYQGGPQGGPQWAGGNSSNMTTPGRPSSRLRSSPENGFPQGVPNGMASPDAMCKPVGIDGGPGSVGPDGGAYGDSRSAHEEDGKSKSSHEGKSNSRDDKGRGSYRCGRCGVPKKGHVCPYQPKLKRRPDEPPPVLRNAAIQVEMDEFMTLRRLNIQIQGFPESYATTPHMSDDMVVGEPQITAPSLGVASISGGVVAHPGVVGSDVASGEPEAAVSNGTSHATSMQTDSEPVDNKEEDTPSKETKSTSTSP